jgi:hypothetical protein
MGLLARHTPDESPGQERTLGRGFRLSLTPAEHSA